MYVCVCVCMGVSVYVCVCVRARACTRMWPNLDDPLYTLGWFKTNYLYKASPA